MCSRDLVLFWYRFNESKQSSALPNGRYIFPAIVLVFRAEGECKRETLPKLFATVKFLTRPLRVNAITRDKSQFGFLGYIRFSVCFSSSKDISAIPSKVCPKVCMTIVV